MFSIVIYMGGNGRNLVYGPDTNDAAYLYPTLADAVADVPAVLREFPKAEGRLYVRRPDGKHVKV